MCYETSLTKSEPQIEKTYQVSMKVPLLYEPYYHMPAYLYPNLFCIPMESPTEIFPMEWGFIPKWAENDIEKFRKSKYTTWNAKGETVLSSKMYGDAARNRRCLILADGFFEPHYEKNIKGAIPTYCHLKDRELFAFAGIYNEVKPNYWNVSLITTKANTQFQDIHNKKKNPEERRMPLVLDRSMEWEWLFPDLKEKDIEELIATGFTRETIHSKFVTQDLYKSGIPNEELNNPEVLKEVNYSNKES